MDLSLFDDEGDNCSQIDNTTYDTKTNDISINHAKIKVGALIIETTVNES